MYRGLLSFYDSGSSQVAVGWVWRISCLLGPSDGPPQSSSPIKLVYATCSLDWQFQPNIFWPLGLLTLWWINISVVSTRTIPTPKGMKTADFCGSPWIQLALAIFSLGTAHQPGDFRGSAGRNGWMLSEENGHESILGGSWTAGIRSGWICRKTRLQVWKLSSRGHTWQWIYCRQSFIRNINIHPILEYAWTPKDELVII